MANFIKLKADMINSESPETTHYDLDFYVNFEDVRYYCEIDGLVHVMFKNEFELQSFKSTLSDVNQQLKQNQIANYFKTS